MTCHDAPVQGPIYAESGGGHDERRVSPDMERKIDAEVHRIVREAYQRAIDLLVRRSRDDSPCQMKSTSCILIVSACTGLDACLS